MINIRKADERGHAQYNWLDTYHTFSFDTYHDPNQMGFRSLRVINEDRVAPGQGFGMHPHKDMEIITFVLEGELEHKDDMGNGSVIKPGDVQKMSAGTGVLHSEFNHSKVEDVHLYQIWIRPNEQGAEPYYEQEFFADEKKLNQLCLIASNNAENGVIKLYQDAMLFGSILEADKQLEYKIEHDRYLWLQVISGAIDINGTIFNTSDGAAISDECEITIKAVEKAEFLLFDLS